MAGPGAGVGRSAPSRPKARTSIPGPPARHPRCATRKMQHATYGMQLATCREPTTTSSATCHVDHAACAGTSARSTGDRVLSRVPREYLYRTDRRHAFHDLPEDDVLPCARAHKHTHAHTHVRMHSRTCREQAAGHARTYSRTRAHARAHTRTRAPNGAGAREPAGGRARTVEVRRRDGRDEELRPVRVPAAAVGLGRPRWAHWTALGKRPSATS